MILNNEQQHVLEKAKEVGDVIAAGGTIAVILDWAPAVAAVFTALYCIFRLFEAIDNWLWKRKQRKLNNDDSA